VEQLDLLNVGECSLTSGAAKSLLVRAPDGSAPSENVSERPLRVPALKRAREADAWSLEPHVCRHCGGGRLVSQALDAGGRRYLCTNCGAQSDAGGPAPLCFCGLRIRRHGPGGGFTDPGVRCHQNPAPSPEFPSVIVASEMPPEPPK